MTGLQGIAEPFSQGVTIYLLPGLAGWQRRAVIRRLRQEASRGCGPALPLAQLILALVLDRVRGALGLTAGAVRLHPRTTLVPVGFVAALLALFVLVPTGVGPGRAVRPALASAQSGADLSSAVGAGHGGDPGSAVRRPNGAGNRSSGIRPNSIRPGSSSGSGGSGSGNTGAGGRGLGSGQPARTGSRSGGRPHAARVCFGAMPGVAAKHSPLSCHRTSS